MEFEIFSLPSLNGALALSPLPGRSGAYAAVLARVVNWAPNLVLSMTETAEMHRVGAGQLGADLGAHGIGWVHLPIRDFGAPTGVTLTAWPEASRRARSVLDQGGRVLVNCFGGCGRSGMAVVRVLVEAGEAPAAAVDRLRAVRPCAIETEAQLHWATHPGALKTHRV